MGERAWKVYGMWDQVSNWWVHLRTRKGAGAGRDGHGREYPPDLQALRDNKNQSGSLDGSESQKAEGKSSWLKIVQDPATSWEKFQMEEEAKRTIGPQKQWRIDMNKSQFMQSFGKVSEAFSKIDEYSIAPLIANAVDVANIKLEQKIDEWSFAIIMSAIAEAKIAQMPERVDAYHESVMWMTIAAAIKTDKGIRLPQVQADIATALSNVNFVETK
jgi:hypothetical protein